ncbi:MAG TPA: polyprenyl diphosphate synthase [Rhodanobacteraceae bacterium]|nr:polyprenyl diphosphate synthase [Rhodanobacteraceae bacterium]
MTQVIDSSSDTNPPISTTLPNPAAIRRFGRFGLTRLLRLLTHPLYWLYEKRLEGHLESAGMPKHIGLILDGNRRFACHSGLDVRLGHRFGIDKLKTFLEWCLEFQVEHVTLFVFSTENFNRAPAEVQYLLDLFVQESAKLLDGARMQSEKVRVKIIGQRDKLPPKVLEASEALELSTAGHEGMLLTIALAYGGREEIVDAVKALLADAESKGETFATVSEKLCSTQLGSYLYTAGQPDPDFIIRTSGEQRLSGFLLWQAAYSELYFCDALWPEFRRVDFLRALRDYQRRERRYGG